MNLYIEFFALGIEILVFLFYFLNRKSIIKYNGIYLVLNFFITFSILLDLNIMIYIKFRGITPISFVMGHFYFLSLLLESCMLLVYAVKQIYKHNVKNHNIIIFIAHILLIIGIFSTILAKLGIDKDEYNQVILIGPAVFIVYGFSAAFMLLNLALTLIKRNKINRRKVLGITIYIAIWLISVVYQFIVNIIFKNKLDMCLGGLPSAIGSLILYALIENPENNTDSLYGVLNDHAFVKFVNKNYKIRKRHDVIIVSFDKSYYTTREEFTDVLVSATHIVSKCADKIFKYDSSTFIIFRDRNRNNDLVEGIKNMNSLISEYSKNNELVHSSIKVISKQHTFASAKDFIRDVVEIIKTTKVYNNSIEVLSELDILRIENEIRISELVDQSIKYNHLLINYQGIYSKEKKKFNSAEVLVRLLNNDGNIIYPISFIPMIEEDGRIVELGKLIFDNVCNFISRNDLDELGLEYLEINLSPKQIQDPNFVSSYMAIIKKYHINPKYINLEITETSKGTNQEIIEKMNQLKEYGVTFSLDDFGTGNSNLNYIVNLPVNIIKFDKTMVSSYFNNQIANVVVDYSIKMIKGLGHKIVFEGIEKKNEVDRIENMDVDYIQGFFYSKPLGEKDFVKLVKEHNK